MAIVTQWKYFFNEKGNVPQCPSVVMAAGCLQSSSGLKQNNLCDAFNLEKTKEQILPKSIVYDGLRVKWCDSYECLQEFIKNAFGQQGKWWLCGGSAKRFDASTSDFIVIWYPGKLNTLTFKGECGRLAKDYLISLFGCSFQKDLVKIRSHYSGPDDEAGNFMLEIDILKSRMDAIQSLLDS